MELTSPESILELLRVHANSDRPARNRHERVAARSTNKSRRMRCTCGHCQQCTENARWERIFAKKFVDPEYYTRRIVPSSSPLASL